MRRVSAHNGTERFSTCGRRGTKSRIFFIQIDRSIFILFAWIVDKLFFSLWMWKHRINTARNKIPFGILCFTRIKYSYRIDLYTSALLNTFIFRIFLYICMFDNAIKRSYRSNCSHITVGLDCLNFTAVLSWCTACVFQLRTVTRSTYTVYLHVLAKCFHG